MLWLIHRIHKKLLFHLFLVNYSDPHTGSVLAQGTLKWKTLCILYWVFFVVECIPSKAPL